MVAAAAAFEDLYSSSRFADALGRTAAETLARCALLRLKLTLKLGAKAEPPLVAGDQDSAAAAPSRQTVQRVFPLRTRPLRFLVNESRALASEVGAGREHNGVRRAADSPLSATRLRSENSACRVTH